MPKGAVKKARSKIQKYKLRLLLLELRAKGYNYREIADKINASCDARITRMDLSRFYRAEDGKVFSSVKSENLDSMLSEIQNNAIVKTTKLLDDTRGMFLRIYSSLDKSTLKPVERGNLKKRLHAIEKEHISDILDSRADIIATFHTFKRHDENIDKMLIGISNIVCKKCGDAIVDYLSKARA